MMSEGDHESCDDEMGNENNEPPLPMVSLKITSPIFIFTTRKKQNRNFLTIIYFLTVVLSVQRRQYLRPGKEM